MTDNEPSVQPGQPTTSRPFSRARSVVRRTAMVAVLGFAIHVLLPQLGELEQGLQALRTGRWPFLGLALAGSGVSFLAGAWSVRASVDLPIPWVRTTQVQVAATAAGVLTPMGVGWLAVNEGFLERQGVDEPVARAANGLNMLLTFVSHAGLLIALLPFLPTLSLPTVSPPQKRVFVDIAVFAAVISGVAVWIPRIRHKTVAAVRPVLASVPAVLRDPRRSGAMVAAAAAANLAYALALYGSVAAFGDAPAPLGIVVVYLVAATVAAVAPTPGGLGAMETALVAALTRLAVPGGQAVAATLAFRVATFWIPLMIGSLILRRARRQRWI